jgi:hypothetical protein
MARPPKDADPEKFIIGRGGYSNLRTAMPYFDEREFRVDPVPMPVLSIVILNSIFILFFFGMFWLTWHYGRQEPGAIAAIVGIGSFTCVGFTVLVWYRVRRDQQLGPWLIYDKATGRVTLPREEAAFERQEIVHVQYITTKRLDWGGVINMSHVQN